MSLIIRDALIAVMLERIVFWIVIIDSYKKIVVIVA